MATEFEYLTMPHQAIPLRKLDTGIREREIDINYQGWADVATWLNPPTPSPPPHPGLPL